MSEPVPPLSRRRRTALLAVVALALMMVVSAVSGLNVALPDLATSLDATQTQITWIVDAYTLAFVGLLLPAINSAREAGRRTQCQSNMRNVGLAILGYVNSKNAFPPAGEFC